MEDKRVNLIAASTIISLIIIVVVSRVILKLSRAFFLIAGADGAVIFAVFAWLLIRRRYNDRRKILETQLVSEGRELRIEYSFLRKVAGVPTKFRYKEIEEATDSFQALVGRGASASVFQGILIDGTSIAVKRIEGEERGEKEFRSEVAAIASVQHVNLVRLIGYCCVQGGPRFLVYEFIRNGSLDSWIFPRKESENRNQQRRPGGCLSWGQRYRVALDVAKALSYLHHDCRSRILHLDVKPENILLDENYRAIVADFGLSKLLGKDESRCITTIRGTRGYLAPEWLLEQGVSEKCDIYSYGMVLLEMIGGRRNVCLMKEKPSKKWNYFPKIVKEKLREGKILEVVDQRVIVGGGVDEREVKRMACVGLWCIQERVRLRPSMTRVLEMLEGRVAVEEPPDTDMIAIDLLSIDEEEAVDGHPNRARVAPLMVEGVNRETVRTTSINSFAMSDISPR
ncbi:receptor-like protein kinase [Tripterygium wilfordii]|uniref:Receptor-like protein kinase n=1 Tax=Tripterygium wilfordii TaxID=458696 RepID=A0A7J7D6P0_TRIWF|nr:probable receptor-like protein kinase At5g20050 [Tripterygium wilfordii]KAF5741971.1 receptor-like protein kinase [Tripterygium wilfordii]